MIFTDPRTGDPIVTPCAQTDPELFFSTNVGDQRRAKQVCASCPMAARKDCLERAQDFEAHHGHGYRFGIWAGLGPYERSRLTDRRVA